MRHLDLLQRFLLKIIEGKNWIQKLLEVVKTPNKSNENPKTQLSSTEILVSEQPPGLLTKEIGKGVLFDYESTNSRTGRLVKSCVSVSVERVDTDKDADENVDADQIRTVRPIVTEQTSRSSAQEIDTRVSLDCKNTHLFVER